MRQSFSHGRTKQVVVEKVKRAPPAGRSRAGRAVERQAGRAGAAASRAAPQRRSRRRPQPAAAASASGVVLRTLTEEERNARAHALADASVREAEERKIAEEEAARRASREGIEQAEREAAEARKRDEDERRRHDEEAKKQGRAGSQEALWRGRDDRKARRAALPARARVAATEADEDEGPRTVRRGPAAPRAPQPPRSRARPTGAKSAAAA